MSLSVAAVSVSLSVVPVSADRASLSVVSVYVVSVAAHLRQEGAKQQIDVATF